MQKPLGKPLHLVLIVIYIIFKLENSFCVNLVAIPRYDYSCTKSRYQMYVYDSHASHSHTSYCSRMEGYSSGTKCYLQLCEIPPTGRISNRNVWTICSSSNSNLATGLKSWITTSMKRSTCDNFKGSWHGRAERDDYVDCGLHWCEYNGTKKQDFDGIEFASVGQCGSSKVGDAALMMTNLNCGRVGGDWKGRPYSSTYEKCFLDLCAPINCEPRDEWMDIKQCGDLTSGSELTCTYKETVGIQRMVGSSSNYGGSVSTSVEATVGFQVGAIFVRSSASITAGLTTGFNWSKTRSSSSTFSKTVTNELSVAVPPGKIVKIQQVVGFCGDYRVYADSIRIVEVE